MRHPDSCPEPASPTRQREGGLLRAKLFADSVDEEFDAAAPWAHIEVEVLALDEQLPKFAEGAPVGSFVKSLAAHVLERRVTARTADRVPLRAGHHVKVRIFHAFPGCPALPADAEIVVHRLGALGASPHTPNNTTPAQVGSLRRRACFLPHGAACSAFFHLILNTTSHADGSCSPTCEAP